MDVTLTNFDQEDDDDTLSLRDLPIATTAAAIATATTNSTDSSPHSTTIVDLRHTSRRQSSTSSDSFFEFLTSLDDNSDVTASPADDVIVDGHILPYAPPTPRCPRRSLSLNSAESRSESISHAPETNSSGAVIRQSRSLNSRKLHRSDTKAEASSLLYSRSSSGNNSSRCRSNCGDHINPIKSSWYYWLSFGLPVRIPAEKEVKVLKHRQSRRNIPPPRFFPGDRSSVGTSASWRVLNVLSCKSHNSVDVMTMPPIVP